MGIVGPFPGGKARPGRNADNSTLHLVPRPRMSRSYTSSPSLSPARRVAVQLLPLTSYHNLERSGSCCHFISRCYYVIVSCNSEDRWKPRQGKSPPGRKFDPDRNPLDADLNRYRISSKVGDTFLESGAVSESLLDELEKMKTLLPLSGI
jgi:hypothetical protein